MNNLLPSAALHMRPTGLVELPAFDGKPAGVWTYGFLALIRFLVASQPSLALASCLLSVFLN